ncbi:hypothetical protein JD844_015408 [Phrynosoma platyrhinos]|uniref:CAP-Gly domain-containing protein n=1 Tax=Phrynosoma platyrhinos TaxID=52577 RepID=A0ABQ7SJ22_PHRPL|nr:hypothetical protein JD844_015408 [Phrynosoma platyrhinos]
MHGDLAGELLCCMFVCEGQEQDWGAGIQEQQNLSGTDNGGGLREIPGPLKCNFLLFAGRASCQEKTYGAAGKLGSPEPDLEIVVCSGYGKNGALSVLQKSIRPQVVTTFELPGCYDMWTVIAPQKNETTTGESVEKESTPPEPPDDGKRHGFLILSREDSTMILQTGQEIMELDTSGFATQGPTVYAGNIGENRYIVQVSPLGIRLLEGVNQLHFIPVDLGSPIVQCAVADPYVVIMSSEGQVSMFVLKSDTYGGRTHRLTLQKPQLHHQSKVIALCVYRDVSGMFTTESHSSSSRDELSLRSHNTVDDEEEMLYGDSSSLFSPNKEEPRRSSLPSADRDPHQYKAEPTHWCIYQLPEWRLVFLVKNFPMGQRVLVDSSFGQPASQGEAKKEEVIRQTEMPLVKEVHVDQELLIYEAFNHDSQLGQTNLKVRFKKVPHNINFREKKPRLSKKKPESVGGEDLGAPRGRVARFRYFEDIYGYSGVFICGPSPHWLLVTSRGALRLHPMTIDGPIESFAPFHNVNCPKGFLYFNRQVYAVATSINNSCTRIPRMTGEEKEFETIERGGEQGLVYLHCAECHLTLGYKKLISPVSWETIPNTRIDLEEWEHVTCMKTVSLKSEETVSGLKGYIAVGTCLMQGEEVTCRGRILIMDIIEVVPEPGQPLTKNKFKVLYEKEQKGPIFLWSLKDNDLTGMAFIDTQLYIHQMISVKNFILAADVMKSISLLRYQEESKTLSLVSRDAKPLEVYSVDFMVDNAQLGFLVSDRDRNLLVYMYLPEATLDGGIGLLLPMQEKTYRRLLMLQNALTTMLPHHAGLNPRAFRMLHMDRRILQNAVRNILDGELLNRYLYLSTMERSELAKKIGTTPDIILEDLLEIDRSMCYLKEQIYLRHISMASTRFWRFIMEDDGSVVTMDVESLQPLNDKVVDFLLAITNVQERLNCFLERHVLDAALNARLGQQVLVELDRQTFLGTICYIGKLHRSPLPSGHSPVYFGVELQGNGEGKGHCDGTYNGKEYFKCKQNCGLFVPLNKLQFLQALENGNGREEEKVDEVVMPVKVGDTIGFYSDNAFTRGIAMDVYKEGSTWLVKVCPEEEGSADDFRVVPMDSVVKEELLSPGFELENDFGSFQEQLKRKRSESTEEKEKKSLSLGVNSMVQINLEKGNSVTGTIRWIGCLPKTQHKMAGIELDEEKGVSDGEFEGVRYFLCPPKRGLFVRLELCQPDMRFQSKPQNSWEPTGLEKYSGGSDAPGVLSNFPPLRDDMAVNVLHGQMRGIQGHCNSCYMDAALFSLFSCTSVLDSMLFKPALPQDGQVQKILRDKIVNPLRQNGFVAARSVMDLRHQLTEKGECSSFATSEKGGGVSSPFEFYTTVWSGRLKEQGCYCYQIFMDKQEDLVVPNVQQLVEHSFLSSDLKLVEAHSHYQRKGHRTTKLHIPEEFRRGNHHGSLRVPREKLELFAVLCIETSHYVSFVKYGPDKENWMFFDSMADRHGDENGYNIPTVTLCPEVAKYLEMPVAALAMEQPRDMEGVAKRLFCDAYMYMYQSKKMALYK